MSTLNEKEQAQLLVILDLLGTSEADDKEYRLVLLEKLIVLIQKLAC